MDTLSQKRHTVIIYVLLAAAVMIAYERVRLNEFAYDDEGYILKNYYIQSGIIPASVKWAFTGVHSANWHPLTWLSHMLDYELFGLNPVGHHIVNVIIHTINSLLLFWILKKMTGRIGCSAFVAAAFALHPVHVESVAWVAERKDLLSAFFAFLTIAAYIGYCARPGVGRYIRVFLFLALGLMAKPMLVTLPFVLVLLDYWPLNRIKALPDTLNKTEYPQVTAGRLILEKIPLFILVIASCVITFKAQHSAGAMTGAEILSFKIRAANALISYVEYLGKMIVPLDLCAFYPYRGDNIPMYKPALSLLFLATVTITVLWILRRKRYLAVGWLWYLGMLVPVIGMVQVGSQAMADRYTYLPGIGFFIMITWGISDLLTNQRLGKMALTVLAGVLIVAMIAGTRKQTSYWKNNVTLFSRTLGVTQTNQGPLSPEEYASSLEKQYDEIQRNCKKTVKVDLRFVFAYYYLGEFYLDLNQIDRAMACYIKSNQNGPDFHFASQRRAEIYEMRGETDKAIALWREIIEKHPKYSTAHYSLGLFFVEKGDYDQAEEHFRQALKLREDYYQAANNLAFVLEKKGKIDEAIELWQYVLRIKPDYVYAHYSLGMATYIQGHFYQALEHFTKALESNPEWFEVHLRMGDIYYQQKLYQKAIDHWNMAIKIKPDVSEVLNKLAWILATCGDESLRNPRDALQYAQKACELTDYLDYANLDTLSAAYAAAGEFDKAVETAEKSIQLANDAGNTAHAQDTATRLELFQNHQPYYQATSDAMK
ncbi:MAG: tetratricopeptide repeat protein [Sedimentisphaerales bacterium]|nr:tetratricopeptide repeat protein [Sedimentisphaerales bacterium]